MSDLGRKWIGVGTGALGALAFDDEATALQYAQDCGVGEVVEYVPAKGVSGMSVMGHWPAKPCYLAVSRESGWAHVVVENDREAAKWREAGWRVVRYVPADDSEGAVDRIKALRDRVRPDDPDPREAAYARGYRAAVTDALESLVGGQ